MKVPEYIFSFLTWVWVKCKNIFSPLKARRLWFHVFFKKNLGTAQNSRITFNWCVKIMFIYLFCDILTACSEHNQTQKCLGYQILQQNGKRSNKRFDLVAWKPKNVSDGNPHPAGVLSHFSSALPYLSLGKADDDTQQALALREMIKMFINTDPSRWWNLSHTPAAPTWNRLRDMTLPTHKSIRARTKVPHSLRRWPPGPTCDKQYAMSPLSCQVNKQCVKSIVIYTHTNRPPSAE